MATKLKEETVGDILNRMPVVQDHPNLAAAMAVAFGEIEAATKSAENPAFKQGGKASKYADLTSIIEAIKPPLIRHGLFLTQRCVPAEDGVSVETVLHHASGEKESLGVLYVPANNRNAQGFGSALTYARRYALQTAFCVPVEDDDGNAGSNGVSARPSTGEQPPKARQKLDDLDGKPAPYPYMTHLMTAAREFVHTLHGLGDLAEYTAWTQTPDAQEFVAQCKRDLPSWWFGGDDAPGDWIPLQIQVARKKKELEELEEINTRANA